MNKYKNFSDQDLNSIAIIGMSCRFPGANTIEEFWQNLILGKETIKHFTKEELLNANIKSELLEHPNYVKARGVLNDAEKFDAAFFNFSAHEARITDPQHRIMLELAVEALESSGYTPQKYSGAIGVYTGCAESNYHKNQLANNNQNKQPADPLSLQIANNIEFLSTKISYKLNLTGPSLNINTACSSALAAVALACQSLLDYECDMALAGGISLQFPQTIGYEYSRESILSPDGHCRAFDSNSNGTVISSGAGLVVLKRYKDAIIDRDNIIAIIRGFAINNDGNQKVSFTAPSVTGQAACLKQALLSAEINPSDIQYIETHGTGTQLGDVVEIEALKKAYDLTNDQKHSCALGSVKTNIGHTDVASGIAGLIKTACSINEAILPPTLNFKNPNPKLHLEKTRFYITNKTQDWPTSLDNRLAAISSFGIGGTNVHLILENATANYHPSILEPVFILTLSAKTKTALLKMRENLLNYLKKRPKLSPEDLANIAYTLQVGRTDYAYRTTITCSNRLTAIKQLKLKDFTIIKNSEKQPCLLIDTARTSTSPVYLNKALYTNITAIKNTVDECSDIISGIYGVDIKPQILQSTDQNSKAHLENDVRSSVNFILQLIIIRFILSLGVKAENISSKTFQESLEEYLAKKTTLKQIFLDLMETNSNTPDLESAPIHPDNKRSFSPVILTLINHHTTEEFNLAAVEQSTDMKRRTTTINKTTLFNIAAALWLHGFKINWLPLYESTQTRRLKLPVYPFERKNYSIRSISKNEAIPHKENIADVESWLYKPVWQTQILATVTKKHEPGSYILFGHDNHFFHHIASALVSKGCNITTVFSGDCFRQLSTNSYIIDITNSEHYNELVKTLKNGRIVPDHLISMVLFNNQQFMTHQKIQTDKILLSFNHLIYYIKALSSNNITEQQSWNIITNNTALISEDDYICPEKLTIQAPCKTIPQEYPNIKCRHIDIDEVTFLSTSTSARNCSFINELLTEPADLTIAYRNNIRFVENYFPIKSLREKCRKITIKKNGVYIITGGTGNMGLVFARYIAQQTQTHIVLLNRNRFPPPSDWDGWLKNHKTENKTSKKIKQLKEIVKLGSDVTIRAVDISDFTQLQATFSNTEKNIGKINGIIHAAGHIGKDIHTLINNITQKHIDEQFQPKIYGTANLYQLCHKKPIDFVILCSSLSNILGGIGFTTYSAANIYMDSFTIQQSNNNWYTMNWDGWNFDQNLHPDYMSSTEGTKAFNLILNNPISHRFVIAKTELTARINKWINPREFLNEQYTTKIAPNSTSKHNTKQTEQSAIQKEVSNIFSECLGSTDIDPNEDFFNLGGNSLLAIRLISDIEKRLNYKIGLFELYELKTITKLTERIESAEKISTKSLVALNDRGDKTPLFLMHPLGGTAFFYLPLVNHLNNSRPVYALRDPAIDHQKIIYTTVEEMATAYLNEIRKIQPKGPYHLAGFSFGALLAVEIAKQMLINQDKINFLGLIEGWALSSQFFNKREWLNEYILTLPERYRDEFIPKHTTNKQLWLDLLWHRMRLTLNYNVPTIKHDATLFKATEILPEYAEIDDPYNHWKKHIEGRVAVIKLSGSHNTIMTEPRVKNLANKINDCLADISTPIHTV